jgi:hypothetical protein
MEATLMMAHVFGRLNTLCVKFVGPDGRWVSLAFDVRGDETKYGDSCTITEFEIYRDCPVQAEGVTDNAPVADLPLLLVDLG